MPPSVDDPSVVDWTDTYCSPFASAFECSFHLARLGHTEEYVAARVGQAMVSLDAIRNLLPDVVLGAIKAGYEFGVATRDKTPDEIWDAWQANPRSFTSLKNNQP